MRLTRTMLRLYVFLIFIWIKEVSACGCENDTDLVMVFLVNRHGDRTPMKSELFFSNSRDDLEEQCKRYGYGELTDVGKARAFALGKLFRKRYPGLLPPTYDCKKVYVDATDFDRTVMTAKIALTAAFSPAKEWCEDLQLLPIEFNIVPAEENPNIAFMNCPRYLKYFYDTFKQCPPQMTPFRQLLEDISQSTSIDLVKYPMALYSLYDLGTSQLNMGIPLCDIQSQKWNEIEEAASTALDILEGNEDYLTLQAGSLLKEFLDSVDQIIAGVDTPKFRLYSTHKFNVFSFMAIIKAIPKLKVPKYCSVAGLELRKSKHDGRYIVVPVYISSPDATPQYLRIKGCGPLCDLDNFRELISDYVLDKSEYKTRCKCDDESEFQEYKGIDYASFPLKIFNFFWNKFTNFFQ